MSFTSEDEDQTAAACKDIEAGVEGMRIFAELLVSSIVESNTSINEHDNTINLSKLKENSTPWIRDAIESAVNPDGLLDSVDYSAISVNLLPKVKAHLETSYITHELKAQLTNMEIENVEIVYQDIVAQCNLPKLKDMEATKER